MAEQLAGPLALGRTRVPTRGLGTLTETERKRLMEACEEFESIFTHMLLRSMRRSVPKTDLFHGGTGEDIFQDMMDQEIAIRASGSGQLGLAQTLYDQLSRSRLE